MDFSSFAFKPDEAKKSAAVDVEIIPIDNQAREHLQTRHDNATRMLVACLVSQAGLILAKTECFSKPAEYDDLSELYYRSKESGATNVLAVPSMNPSVVTVYFKVGVVNSCVNVSMLDIVQKELFDRVGIKEVTRWYLYLVSCLTHFNQGRTLFFNIDSSVKLKEAFERVNSGEYDLPYNEFIYLNLQEFTFSKGDVIRSTDIVLKPGEKSVAVADIDFKHDTEIVIPEVDLIGMEDRFYNMYVHMLLKQDVIGADTETTGLDVFTSELVSLGITFDTKIGYYLSFGHKRPATKPLYIGEKGVIRHIAGLKGYGYCVQNNGPYLNLYGSNECNLTKDDLNATVTILKQKKLIFHNAKFDYNILLTATGKNLPIFMDTMLAHYVSRPGFDDLSRDKRGLKHIAVRELGVPEWKADITKCQKEHKDLVAAYNARDTCYMLGMAFSMGRDLKPIWKLFKNIEMDFLPVLMSAERAGVGLDVKKLKTIEVDLKAKMSDIKEHFASYFKEGEKFNINSGPVLKDLFFNRWGVVPIRKCRTCGMRHQYKHTKCINESCVKYDEEDSAPVAYVTPAGDPALDKFALGALAKVGVDGAKQLMEYRAASKLVTSYTNLDTKIHPLTGYLHPSYNQARTATGRLCIAKGSKVEIVRDISRYPEGVPIEDVHAGDYAYTYDDDRKLTIKKILWAGTTGTKKVIRIHWIGSGRHTYGHLDLTPTHPVRLITGDYVEAKELTPGSRILSLSRTRTGEYSRLHAFGDLEIRDHRLIMEGLGHSLNGKHVHHIDGNKSNNTIANLEIMGKREHARHHGREEMRLHPERVERFRRQALKMWSEGKGQVRYGKDAPMWRETSRLEAIRLGARCKGKIKFVDMDFETYKKKCAENEVSDRAIHYRYTRDGEYISKYMVSEILKETPRGKEFSRKLNITKAHFAGLSKYFANNHQVVRIEYLNEEVDVYDLEVEDTHNFIANELCVHNSSSNPNFQQLPKKAGKYIRGCIIPKPKHCLIAADYAGQEIRILAAYSKDPKLIQAYNPCYKCPYNSDPDWVSQFGKCSKESHEKGSRCNVVDIHSYITKQIHGDAIDVDVSEIKDHPVYDRLRTIAKSVTFALAYGGSAYGIADTNNIPLHEADAILKQYFETFPEVKKFILNCQLYVDEHGCITDMVNRTRRFKYAGYKDTEKEAEYYDTYYFRDGLRGLTKLYGKWVRKDRRAATNFPVQSMAASMTKVAAIELEKAIRFSGIDAQIIQFIHDEILLTCHRDRESIEIALRLVKESMVDNINMGRFNMPNHPLGWKWPPYLDMETDISIGDSYGSLMKPREYFALLDGAEHIIHSKESGPVELIDMEANDII